jgi:diaminohydroxyphosphoribosylaminopyrimidine deaminase/5-amino-6-(5-phosphoribosylamino)uracil reductase
MSLFSRSDRALMGRAIALAERGRGRTGTNPVVGAVVSRGGRVVAAGWHARYGGPHAEAVALAAAGERARGASLYVTLEPCSRLGKTPPCSRMIAAAGVRRVVYGLADPHERGAGAAALRRAGVDAVGGCLEWEIRSQLAEWLTSVRLRRPHVTLKLAATLDGRTADAWGRSKWISSTATRRRIRSLRGRCDAMLVGARTVRLDDPRLSAPGRRDGPLKVVVDGRLSIAGRRLRLLRGAPVVAACAADAPASREARLRRDGVRVLRLPGRRRFRLRALLEVLYASGVGAVWCEGGADVAGGLLREGLADRVVWVTAPMILGNRPLRRAVRLRGVTVERIGDDAVISGGVRGR